MTATSKRDQRLAKIVKIIQRNPGIRPSELNRRSNLEQPMRYAMR
jgi:hypothetical protein